MLAGKRVASHWIRRTLICERLEDCQQQCGEERRFSCEGFNYRIDPSGRGQGECELVEMPLSQMDLYSSQHNRDINLIPHPDYDFYERDRTPSNCRPNCIDCITNSNSNYLPSNSNSNNNRPPPPLSGSYKPSSSSSSSFESDRDRDRYRPDTTAIDKYRPQNNFYESRPGQQESWDRYGSSNFYSGGSSEHHNFRPYPDSRPPQPPPYGSTSSIDRYGVEENGPDYFKPPYRPSSSSSSSSNNPNGYIDTGEYSFQPPAVIPVQQKPYDRPPQQTYDRPNPQQTYDRPPQQSFERPQQPYDRPQQPFERPPQQLPPRPISTDSGNYNRPLPPPQSIPQKPSTDYDRPDPPYSQSKPDLPPHQSGSYGGSSGSNSHPIQSLPPSRPSLGIGSGYHEREPPSHHHLQPSPNYHPTNFHQKPSAGFVPYMIGSHENSWGMYGGSYGSASYRPQNSDYWGLKNEIKRIDGPQQFNYYELGPVEDNSVYHHRYGGAQSMPMPQHPAAPPPPYGPMNFGSMWTRRPGMEGKTFS